jgi:hypothetical protein
MPDEGERPGDVESGEHLGKVVAELVNPVGTHRRRCRPAVAAVIVADDPHRSAVSA